MLNKILLVDDDQPTNLLNTIIIERLNCCKEIVCKERGDLAIDYLQELFEKGELAPDLILLDINMPGMNGWEFLEAYDKLDQKAKAKVIIVMLTTSLSRTDSDKAKKIGILKAFESKPLSKGKMAKILKKHFPDLELTL
ncbi:response regulator [Luteibaculum oceani]|uniref:Response regulator n=1 Tax=Luteibaculum oceani TaxID=1294296 RepID=A0A5C6US67_9FLAO|nr:response regulator [Luteibaculum oceani]TXC76077.1 response regulator [Luteibaculum oceani]